MFCDWKSLVIAKKHSVASRDAICSPAAIRYLAIPQSQSNTGQ